MTATSGNSGSTGRLSWSGGPATTLRLRVTCAPGGTAALLTDARVSS